MEDDYLTICENASDGRKYMVYESIFFKLLYIFLKEKGVWEEFYEDYSKKIKVGCLWDLKNAKQFERGLSQNHFVVLLDYVKRDKYKELSDDFEKLLVKLNIVQD